MSSKIITAVKYIFLSLAFIISVFPLIWMVIAATNKSVDVIAGKLTFGTHLLENYNNLIAQQPLWSSFWNSCKYSVLVTVFALLVSSMAGYAFEIYKDKTNNEFINFNLACNIYPQKKCEGFAAPIMASSSNYTINSYLYYKSAAQTTQDLLSYHQSRWAGGLTSYNNYINK